MANLKKNQSSEKELSFEEFKASVLLLSKYELIFF
jgi:hypothetical protein